MRRIPRWMFLLAALVAGIILLRLTVFRGAAILVDAARVETGMVEETLSNTRAGTVKARRRARLSPELGGVVAALPHRKGARVEAGTLLLQLDDSVQQAQVRLAEQDVRTVEARAQEACLAAELAGKDLARGLSLARDGVVSQQTLDALQSANAQAQAACQATRAALDTARAQVKLARTQLALTRIHAPFAGIVADCNTEVGEWITPAAPGVPIPAVLDLIDPHSVYISAPIDEVDSLRVRAGQSVRVTIDSRPGEKLSGKLVRVAPFVLDLLEQNRTVEVEIELEDEAAASGLLPGTSSDAEVILARRDGVLRIPTSAIAEGGKVLVLEDGRLAERVVRTGMRNWQFTEVLAGLRVGEFVVTSRESPDIKPGARAHVRSER